MNYKNIYSQYQKCLVQYRIKLLIIRKIGDFGIWAYSTGKSTIEQQRRNETPPDRVFDNLETALEAGPDAALITNPTFLHLDVANPIARKQIPLFIDKPLDCDLLKANNLQKVVKTNQVPVLVGLTTSG